MTTHAAFSSGGNDSVALIRALKDEGIDVVTVVYNNTGWASPEWALRLTNLREWVRELNYAWHETDSVGMEELVKQRKGWPMPRKGFQFCTEELKIKPSLAWLNEVDPDGDIICCVGVRREESNNRRDHPKWIEESEKHGGRSLYSPLVAHLIEQRDALIRRTPMSILPHGSDECFPCIYANKKDLQRVTEDRLETIERIEGELGFTKKGHPRVMFRPYRQMGAMGIRESIKWAHSPRGGYEPPKGGCSSGYCGN